MRLIDAGLFNLEIFSKSQILVYYGTAVYTVDLSEISASDITYNSTTGKVTIRIPHAKLEPINLHPEDMEIGNTEKGLLAFGDIKLTYEEQKKIASMAIEVMEEELAEQQISLEADKFAKQAVWELFQPVISNVSPYASLEILFKN